MSEVKRQSEVLSREELDALLASLAEERGDGSGSAPYRAESRPGARTDADPRPALQRALESFCQAHSRHISNLFQARIEYALTGWQTQTMGEIAGTSLPADKVAMLEFEPSGTVGFIWLSRPLLFAQLCLLFGARPGARRSPVPSRPYTSIERRLYQRVAGDVLGHLELCWRDLIDAQARLIDVAGPERLKEDSHERVILASIDVRGLGDICRLRIGLPEALFEDVKAPVRVTQPSRRVVVEELISEMPLNVRAEIGSLELTLSELQDLGSGSVIPINTAPDGTLLVRVEGRPKFRGIRGLVGRKLAVQLTQRL